MKSLITHLMEWKEDWKSYAKEHPSAFLSDMENILDSNFFEGIELELDGVRDYLEELRIDIEETMKPKFNVDKLHSLIKLVDITTLVGTYYRQGQHAEALFLNVSGKIRPPVDTHDQFVGDTFSVDEVEALLGGTLLNKEAVLELLGKL